MEELRASKLPSRANLLRSSLWPSFGDLSSREQSDDNSLSHRGQAVFGVGGAGENEARSFASKAC
jgi:hypothetical protein